MDPATPSAPGLPSPASPPGPSPPAAQEGPPRLVQVGVFNQPTHVASPPGQSRLFVVEKGGTIKVVGPDGNAGSVLDIRDQVSAGGERGLLSVAFAPDYDRSRLAYVYFTDRRGDTRVVEYRTDRGTDRFDPAGRREILFVRQPFSNHNGGLLLFDPSGMMLIGLGDGGSSGDPGNRAQDLGEHLGKLLRIDPRRPQADRPYAIPADNPFADRRGARPEIWAYGLRNPWRFSFDRETKDLYVADVGQNRFEEINFVPPQSQSGANYGWRRYEGAQVFKDQSIDESRLISPVVTYRLGRGTCAVTGGYVYRGPVRSLAGTYLYADFCEGQIKGFKMSGTSATGQRSFDTLQASAISSFGEDSRGEVYVTSLEGEVYRIGV